MVLDPNHFEFRHPDPDSRLNKYPAIRYDPELEQIKKDMKDANIWDSDEHQKLFNRAKSGTRQGRQIARKQILQLIENYKVKKVEADDPFMPHATASQISNQGRGIHICNQVGNQIPFFVDTDEFQLNTLDLGRPRAGKTSWIFIVLLLLIMFPFLIFDIKNVWRHRARALNATVIQPPFHVDLEPPAGIQWYDWIFSVLDGLALITGLQYGAVPFIEAAKIALQQREQYINHTHANTSLSLMDIFHALDYVNLSGFKRDYLLSCKTALQLIIGPNELFSARKGIPLAQIFTGRYILECCYLSMIQCRFLAFYILNYLLQASYQCLESAHLRRLIVIDDASFFINRPENAFGSAPSTGFWGHILSKLRGSGTGLLFADQLVQPIFDDVKQLCTNWIVVGGLRDTQNYNEIMAAMNLTRDQAAYIGRMKTRECIAYFPNQYPRPIHGMVPLVPSIAEGENHE